MNLDVKKNFLNLKKLIKEEPGIGKRLQSVRSPRDLNLGGTKLPKKQFVPNLNATRNKDKAKEFLKKNENKRMDRSNYAKRNHDRKNDSKYVQSSGIFSEGAGSDIVRTSRRPDRRYDKENDGGHPAMIMPTFTKNSYEIDKKNEDNVLDDIMGFEEDIGDEKLPFEPISWHNSNYKEAPIKLEIKNELGVTPDLKNLKLEPPPPYWINKEYIEDEGLSNDNPSMSIWRLPDSFAGKGLSDDPNCKKLFDYSLSEMLEGQIGKLVMRKSGKIEVHIGRIKYNLEPSDIEAYKEEIVSVEDTSGTQTTASVLGQIQNRYSLYPDWETLLG
ncbi:hypothetical protein JTB14_035233 [Gonioctena quinquepunctata]|nr:hypothetical protein JTB14_035233 [Gonioctena quinquepunctata]